MRSNSSKGIIAGFTVIFVALAAWWFTTHSGDAPSVVVPQTAIKERRVAPGFNLKDAAGGAHDLQDLKGRAVLVHFWAAWCPPCLDEMPRVLELARSLAGKPVTLVTISLDETWAAAEKILPSSKLPPGAIALLDDTKKLADTWGSYQFPETYLIDPEQKIAYKWVGPQEWENPGLREAIVTVATGGGATAK